MKAFESTTHSPSQFLLYELSSQLNLDQNTRQLAEQFLNDYRDKDESWDENKSKSVVRCSILAACKSSYTRSGGETIHRPVTISIAALLSGSSAPDLHSFILKLKEFSKVIQLEDQPAGEIQRIINNFAFSLTLYNKFEEVWAALEITGLDEKVKRLKNIT